MSDTTLKKAFQLAGQLKELAPWTYMDETYPPDQRHLVTEDRSD